MDKNFYLIKTKSGQVFDKDGNRLAVTYLSAPKTMVLNVTDKDGYQQVTVGLKQKPLPKCPKPQQVLFQKIGTKTGFYYIRELKVDKKLSLQKGDLLSVGQILAEGDFVAVSAKSKGRGFAGVIKRWGFKGGPKTHGQSDRERAIGSIGQRTDPGRVWKGKKMPGHMGNVIQTVGALNILKIDEGKGEVIIKGLVPGASGNLVALGKLAKKPKKTTLAGEVQKPEPAHKETAEKATAPVSESEKSEESKKDKESKPEAKKGQKE